MSEASGLIFSPGLWNSMLSELFSRGNGGETEAGCFVIGRNVNGTRTAEGLVYFDDLDPLAYRTGAISIDTTKLGPLYDLCQRSRLVVTGDVHTHPGLAIQSRIDRRNPAVAVAGHVGVILPFHGVFRSPEQIGIYILQRGGDWARVRPGQNSAFLGLTR